MVQGNKPAKVKFIYHGKSINIDDQWLYLQLEDYVFFKYKAEYAAAAIILFQECDRSAFTTTEMSNLARELNLELSVVRRPDHEIYDIVLRQRVVSEPLFRIRDNPFTVPTTGVYTGYGGTGAYTITYPPEPPSLIDRVATTFNTAVNFITGRE